MNARPDFDTSIFEILTAATENDRVSILQLLALLGDEIGRYAYLEIGSDLGGTLLPVLRDARCRSVVSIDARVAEQPDERGVLFPFPNNTTERMLAMLANYVGPDALAKLRTFDRDASAVTAAELADEFDLAFIDGEHTNVACFSDFVSIMPFMRPDAIIAFHDANLISDAVVNVERMLGVLGRRCSTLFLPDNVAAIGLGRMAGRLDALAPQALRRADYLAKSREERIQTIIALRSQPSPQV